MTQFLKPILILAILGSSLFAKSKKVTWLPSQFQASFVSIDEDVFDGVKKTKGELSYKYPKRLKMEFFSDPKTIYVRNLSDIYLYKAPKFKGVPGELTITKGGSGDLMNFFDSLRVNGLDSNKNYEVQKKGNVVKIIFSKGKAKQLKMTNAQLNFEASKYDFKLIKSIAVTLDSEKVVNYELGNIDVNAKLSKEHFVFKTPKNTNVVTN